MKHVKIVMIALFLSVIPGIGLATAETYVKGRVVSTKGSRLVIEGPRGEKHSFSVNENTTVFVEGAIIPLKALLRNSKVKVVEKSGSASVVIVEEVPK